MSRVSYVLSFATMWLSRSALRTAEGLFELASRAGFWTWILRGRP